ncbi:MAG: YfgM family protein [Mariprofundaceae bacterium]
MNSKTPKPKQGSQEQPLEPSRQELQELKQDMRSAQLTAWLQEHQQKLIAAVVAGVLAIVGISLWTERQASIREAVAVLYQQAMDRQGDEEKKAALNQVISEYGDTSYAVLSLLLMSTLDRDHAIDHLQSLLAHPKRTDELEWQASLDLARLYIQKGDKQAARDLLAGLKPGPAYEQLLHLLLAEAADADAERIKHYQQALEAKSYNTNLNREIEQKLKRLKSETPSES